MVFVTSAVELYAAPNASDLRAKVSYESDLSKLVLTVSSAGNYRMRFHGGSVTIKSGDTTIGTYSLKTSTVGYEVTNIDLAPGNYTLTIPKNVFSCTYEVYEEGSDLGISHSYYYPETTVSFTSCDHSYGTTGVCSKCKRYQRPDNSDGKYHLTNYGNLKWYSEYKDAPAILDNDIIINTGVLNSAGELNSIANIIEWTPFNTSYDFDGNHHSISGLYVNSNEESTGFIGTLTDASVKNLTIKDSYIKGTYYVGGIVGHTRTPCTFIGCLNAATVVSEARVSYVAGILGHDSYNESHITSCLNTGKLVSSMDTDAICSSGNISNCLCLEGTATSLKNSMNQITRSIKAEDLSNGAAVLLLNEGYANDALIWYQKLGTDALPHTYTNGNDIVYGGFEHGNKVPTASNTILSGSYHHFPFDSNGTTEVTGGHGYSIVDGECQVCHITCTHESYENGVCTTCHYHCPHVFVNGFNDGNCSICGMNMKGVYEPAPKAADGYYEVSNGGQLLWVSQHMGSYRLMNDIVVNENLLNADGTLRNPSNIKYKLAENEHLYNIDIDGCGHTISGLYGKYFICGGWLQRGSIKNLGIIDSWFEKSGISEDLTGVEIKNFYSTAIVKEYRICQEFFGSSIDNSFFAGRSSLSAPLFDVIVESTLTNVRTSGNKVYNSELKHVGETIFDNCIKENCQVSVSQKEFNSGKVAYELNKSNNDKKQIWYQTIGVDDYPIFTSNGKNTVNLITDCLNNQNYSNLSQNDLDEDNHNFDEITGVCHFCGTPLPGHQNPEDGYYEIARVGDLYWFKAEAKKNPAINARLMNDIVMNKTINLDDKSSMYEWLGIEDFKGTFDGQNHTISGLFGDPLFENLNNATVSNVGFVDYLMTGANEAVLALFAHNSTISSCYAYNPNGISNSGDILLYNINKTTVDGCYVITSNNNNYIVYTADNETSILNSCVIDQRYSQIVADGNPRLTNCAVLNLEQFADGTATWLLNGARYDGEQSYYQRLGVNNHPILNSTGNNAIYALPDGDGNLWYQNINTMDNHYVIFDGNDYICVFDNAPVHSPLDTHDYFALAAVGRTMTIGLKKTGSPENIKLQYAGMSKAWNTVEINSTNTKILNIAAGDTIYFRWAEDASISALAKSSDDYWTFTMDGEGMVEAGGNILSLLDKKVTINSTIADHAFENLFSGCKRLTVAPSLPSTQLKPFCYANMFAGTGIRKAPELPATDIPEAAYMGMFQECKDLSHAPVLPATKLGSQAYENMFNGCENINSVKLPDAQYDEFDSSAEKNPFRNWLSGTAPVGKLVVSYEFSQNDIINQNKPSGWNYPTYFFKEVKISTDKDTQTALNRLRNEGYIPLEKDLNEDARSGERAYDVYLGYKFTYDPTQAITQLMVIDKIQDDIVHDRQWLTTPYTNYGGKDFYLCPYYGDDKEGACLNRGRIHDVRCLSLFYSKTGNTNPGATFYTSIDRVLRSNISGSKQYVPWLTYGGQYLAHCDTNADFEDENHVRHHTLEVTKEAHSHSYTAVFNWSDDRKSCYADMTCIECGATTKNVGCSISSKQLIAPSCVELGVIRYTATVTIEEQTFTGYTESTYGEFKAHNYCQKQTTEEYLKDASTCTEAATYWFKCANCDAMSTTEFYTSEDEKDKAKGHTYNNEASQDDPEFYICSVCEHEDHCRKTNLSFTAVDADMTIGMAKTGSPDNYMLEYSPDMTTWTTVELTATNSNIVVIPAGKTFYFRHGSATATKQISKGDNSYWTFTMDGEGTVEANGNIMSLIDATCQQTELPSWPQHVFTKLFLNCKKLTVAPKMDAITSVPQWGFVSMFAGSGIKVAPTLSAKSVRDGSYSSMFENCKELVSVPALPATQLTRCSYRYMFKGCEKLTSVEIANITSMDQRTEVSHASFTDWLEGTAVGTTGVLRMPDVLVGNSLIFIPENWNVESIDGHHFVAEKDEDGSDIWVWEGVTKATLKLVCTNNPQHKDELVLTGDDITSEVTTETTCTVDGVRTYTAAVTIDGNESKSTKEDIEPAPGHSYQYGVCIRCSDSPSHFDAFTLTDGDPYLIAHDCNIDELTYSRTFYPNVWNPWFVPFEMTVGELTENGVTDVAAIESIHNYDMDEDGIIDKTVLEVIKKKAGLVKAGTPYLIKTGESYTYPMVFADGKTLKASTATQMTHSETSSAAYDFVGTYTGLNATQLAEATYFSLDGNGALVRRTQNILPQRWYMKEVAKTNIYADDLAPVEARSFVIRVIGEEDEETGIRRFYDNADVNDEEYIFDLSGRKLPQPHRGTINIVNGQKVIVK